MAVEQLTYPQWTEYRKKSGLDPLGMQNSSINLYQRLLPGISNVTLRIRYYGFYAWLARVYAEQNGGTKQNSWKSFLRRAEALYALTSQQSGGESGVAGILWAAKKMPDSENEPIHFAENADPGGSGQPYLQQAWGVFGAAYGSQLYEIGVLSEATEHDIPVPSTQIGEGLAKAFEADLGNIPARFVASIQEGTATVNDLQSFEQIIPSNIGEDTEERQIYEDMLFGKTLTRPDDISRRATLHLILRGAAHLKTSPTVDQLRWLWYAGMNDDGEPFPLADDALEGQRQCWWVYQSNDLLHFSYETLLKFALDTLASYPAGTTLRALLERCVADIEDGAPLWPGTWQEFCDQNPPAANAGSEEDESSDFFLSDEARPGGGDAGTCTAQNAWAALRLIAVVMQRTATAPDLLKENLGKLDPRGFHSLITETAFFAGLGKENFTQTLVRLIEERVIKRHLWVAHRKFRYQGDYTFLIDADEGLIRLRATAGPVFTNPRLGPAIRFLEDLHLIDEDGLTAAGERLVAPA